MLYNAHMREKGDLWKLLQPGNLVQPEAPFGKALTSTYLILLTLTVQT